MPRHYGLVAFAALPVRPSDRPEAPGAPLPSNSELHYRRILQIFPDPLSIPGCAFVVEMNGRAGTNQAGPSEHKFLTEEDET